MGDVEVIGLRTSSGHKGRGFPHRIGLPGVHLFGELLTHRALTPAYRLEIVAYADQLRDIIGQSFEIRHDCGREFHCPFFAIDMRAMALAHEPIGAAINPNIKTVRFDGLHRRLYDVGL